MDQASAGSEKPKVALKEHLKREFGRWAIRQFDANEAFGLWTILWRAESLKPTTAIPTGSVVHLAVLGLVAAYGRVFTGDNHLRSEPPWVLPPERALHDHLIELRHRFVAHSTGDIERVVFFPPGSVVRGEPVTGMDEQDWAWQVHALAIKAMAMDLDAHLRRLHAEIHARSTAAIKRLQKECGYRVLPPGPTRLVDL